jgi:hypothetical protein
MEQVLTGTVHGNTIVLDHPLPVPDGQAVEVLVRDRRTPSPPNVETGNLSDDSRPAWWTDDDDRILEEIYQARKRSTRPEIEE